VTKKNKKKFDPVNFHLLTPDYNQPIFRIKPDLKKHLVEKLESLYGSEKAISCYQELERIIQVYYAYKAPEMIEWESGFNPINRFTEKDVILITYGDLVKDPHQSPLQTVNELSEKYLKGVFNTLHLLPFFPYSSDRGFAVLDFEEVDPALGNWEAIRHLKSNFKLMFDGVFNHVSSKSRWFQEFLDQNPAFSNFFTVFSTKQKISDEHLKLLVRPRTCEVLTSFKTIYGPRLVWTTFGPDQIDLNYKNPKVLTQMTEILLYYIRRGADLIRLDAVTYLWDELGTTGAHLFQTHTIIKLFRDILNAVAPHVGLITETNVAQVENFSYFGDGKDEAQMVYNFALPPLVLYAFQTEKCERLTQWAASLKPISETSTYFNFLDSHDGIGLMGVKNILTSEEIEKMSLTVLEHGGYISYKSESDGTASPYELNITWYSAINREDSTETEDLQVDRYLASRAIALILMGVPGIYLHGLLGSRNDADSVIMEKQTRSINRKTISKSELIRLLMDHNSTTYKVSSKLVNLIRKRISEKAFHPNAPQRILNISDALFTVYRSSQDKKDHILAIVNITSRKVKCEIDLNNLGIDFQNWSDLISSKKLSTSSGSISFNIKPFGIHWFKASI
jgi:glycosidase